MTLLARPEAPMGDEPERTPDGHHVIINGRRWRATDPNIPDKLRTELVNELMRARRAVRTDGDAARPMVQDAKVALGERGDPWWEPSADGQRQRLAATMRTLLRGRDGKTICPSDAARVVGSDDWRSLMDESRSVAIELAGDGLIEIQQKGVVVDPAKANGPIRLAATDALQR